MYAVFLSVGIIWSCYNNVRDREPGWRIGVAIVEGFAMLLLYVGYWVQPLVKPLGMVAPFLFVFSILWTLYHTQILLPKTDIRGLSREGNRMHRGAVLGIMVILNFPAYWFGGISAWRAIS